MRDVAQRLRDALPDGLRTVAIAWLVQLIAVLSGIAPTPAAYQIGLTLVLALLVTAATVWQRRLAPTADTHEGAGGRHAARGLSVLPGELADVTSSFLRRRGPAEDVEQRWARHVQDVHERWERGPEEALAPAPTPSPPEVEPRPAPPGPSARRIAVVVVVSVALAALLWLPLGPVGRVAVTVATFLFGYAGYGLPLLPLLAVGILPPSTREPVPWRRLAGRARRRGRSARSRRYAGPGPAPGPDDVRRTALAALGVVRESVFTRPVGIVLATAALLHLLRDSPGLGGLAYRRAGGIVGLAIAEPLSWLASSSGGIGVLCALMVSAALATAGYLRPYRGREFAAVALVALLLLPLSGLAFGRFFAYDYTLGVHDDRVVVLAGVSSTARHPVEDTGVSTSDMPASIGPMLAAGVPVAGRSDGVRLAKELKQPVAEKTFPATGGDLTVGDCFNIAGPEAQLRYLAFCGAAHAGEVFFIGRLPLVHDPGAAIADAVGRAMCEKSYGAYLGVPFGQSYVAVETPMRIERTQTWTPRPTVACWLRSVGPVRLQGSKLVASLTPEIGWDAIGAGCRTTPPGALTLTADGKDARCVTPGRNRPEGVRSGALTITASLNVTAGFPSGARVGVACLDGADVGSGYYVAAASDGSLELWKHNGIERRAISLAKPKRATTIRSGTLFEVSLVCNLRADGAVAVTASSGELTVTALDQTAPIRRVGPRLFLESRDAAPVTLAVTAFSATVA